jgi:Zn-dependent protease with chaperone function
VSRPASKSVATAVIYFSTNARSASINASELPSGSRRAPLRILRPEFFSTHPNPENRIQRIEEAIQNLDRYPPR